VALPPAGPWEKFVAAVVALLVVAGVALFFLDILFWPALRTLAQDEASCVVFGMPRAAVELKAVAKVAPISIIASTIFNTFRAK